MNIRSDVPLTPDIIKAYVKAGQERASLSIQKCDNAQALVTLFVTTYRECFFRSTRNNPHNVEARERRQMLEGAIKSAAALCLIARDIRRPADKHAACIDAAVKCLVKDKKDFYNYHTQRQLHPSLLRWLDAVTGPLEKPARCEFMKAMRQMFPPVEARPYKSRRQLRHRGAEIKRRIALRHARAA